MKFDKKNVAAAARNLLLEVEGANDIIQAVINEKVRDRHIIASLNVGHASYEIWKKKGESFDVVKSSYPKENTDFRKEMSKKEVEEKVLVDIINKLIKAFTDDKKKIIAKLNENK